MPSEETCTPPEDIRHVRAPKAGPILDVLVALGVEKTAAATLLDLGAIYVERVRAIPGRHDADVAENAYIRIHGHPRRFPLANTVDWRARIHHECEDFVLVNKPGGVPVHPSLDNCVETCVECVSKVVGKQLTALHRLDVPTHGLLVLGRSAAFTSHFNKLLRDRGVHKEYNALLWAPPDTGLMVHYMEPSKRSPKVVSSTAKDGWQDCRLVVKSVRGLSTEELSPQALAVMLEQFRCQSKCGSFPPAVSAWAAHAAEGDAKSGASQSSGPIAFEAQIELLTGRTHQIRAQLSHAGCPLIGDEMYRMQALAARSTLAAGTAEQDAESEGDGNSRRGGSEQQDRAREMEVRGTLALQACKISFGAQLSEAVEQASSKERRRRRRASCEQQDGGCPTGLQPTDQGVDMTEQGVGMPEQSHMVVNGGGGKAAKEAQSDSPSAAPPSTWTFELEGAWWRAQGCSAENTRGVAGP